MFSIIVAVGKNMEIGLNNKLLWHIPEDLKKFKEITTGKTIIMGKNTFDSIGKPLPNRRNIVLSIEEFDKGDLDIEVYNDFDKLIKNLSNLKEEIFIIGGASIYKKAMESGCVSKLYVSHVDFEGEADTFFPEISDEWEKELEEKYIGWKFCRYIKKGDK